MPLRQPPGRHVGLCPTVQCVRGREEHPLSSPRAWMEYIGTFVCMNIAFFPLVPSWIIEQNALWKTAIVWCFVKAANSKLSGLYSPVGAKTPLHELKRWKAWRNSSLLAQAQADSSVCRSNRWPWSWVARKLVIKYFNSDWFGNLRFIKSRVKSFVIQITRCLNSPYFWLVNI